MTAPNRKAEQPIVHLADVAAVLQVDSYAGYRALERKNSVQLAFCSSHVRRRFYKPRPPGRAREALERIAALYAIEKEIRGCAPDGAA